MSEELAETPKKLGNKSPRRWMIPVAAIILATGLAWFSFQYWTAQRELSKLKEPGAAANYEAEQIMTAVGRLVALPNEKPTIATVSDVGKIKDRAFFKEARDGDKVLMFTKAKKVILFRPSNSKIIEMTSLKLTE